MNTILSPRSGCCEDGAVHEHAGGCCGGHRQQPGGQAEPETGGCQGGEGHQHSEHEGGGCCGDHGDNQDHRGHSVTIR